MLKSIVVALLLSLVFTPAAALAGESLKAREKAAKKACASGDSRKGVEILADLYVETDDVTFIFNQGRCYEQNHQWVNAIDRFREYLRKSPDANSSGRADAEKHIADCEGLRAQDKKEEAKQSASPVVPPQQPVASPVSAEQPPVPSHAETVAERSAAPNTDQGAGLRVTGIVLGSVGVAAAVAGLALNLKANSLANDFNRTQSPSTRSSQSSYKTGSIICYGAGAGALVAGVVLYILGHRSGDGPAQVSLIPVLTPTDLSLGIRGAF